MNIVESPLRAFELERDVSNPEVVRELVGYVGEQCVFAAGAGALQMSGESHVGGAHRPDVQIVHVGNAVECEQCCADGSGVDRGPRGAW